MTESDERCPASKFDARCQLVAGHESQSPHVTMVAGRHGRRTGFAIWRSDGKSSWEPEVGDQPWAPSFPRVEG